MRAIANPSGPCGSGSADILSALSAVGASLFTSEPSLTVGLVPRADSTLLLLASCSVGSSTLGSEGSTNLSLSDNPVATARGSDLALSAGETPALPAPRLSFLAEWPFDETPVRLP